MTNFSIGQTVIVNDERRTVCEVKCDGICMMYGTIPEGVKERWEANPELLHESAFRSRYYRMYTGAELITQTYPKELRVPTHMGVLVVRVNAPACAIPAVITTLELPDGTEKELSKVYGFAGQDKVDVYLKDGNVGRTIHKATYTGKSLNIKKEEPHVSDKE